MHKVIANFHFLSLNVRQVLHTRNFRLYDLETVINTFVTYTFIFYFDILFWRPNLQGPLPGVQAYLSAPPRQTSLLHWDCVRLALDSLFLHSIAILHVYPHGYFQCLFQAANKCNF